MKEIRLLKGSHVAPFDEDGSATMCAEEFVAYLAGEPHSDRPRCVSPVLNIFTVIFNDELCDGPRQRLKPYLARQVGTAEDGQDETRSFMALDWLVRTYAPILLEGAGLSEEAGVLRGLGVVGGGSPGLLALNCAVRGGQEAARGVVEREDPKGDQSALRRVAAAQAVIKMNAGDPAGKAALKAARRDHGVRTLLRAWGIDGSPPWGWVCSPVAEMAQEGAFELLDRLIDPGGLHDVSERPLPEAREIRRRSPERAALSVVAGT